MQYAGPVVSIIMPAYNAEAFIRDAIESVLNQTYNAWQLLVINDGSEDRTDEIVSSFHDDRIVHFRQENKGAAAARNIGLANVKGEYVCFLDADDILTPNSIEDRVKFLIQHPSVDFVDGVVHITGKVINQTTRIWCPSFQGVPRCELVRLRDTCFVTISWMIRKEAIAEVRFPEGVSHAEDLIFLTEISSNRAYGFVKKHILYFRRTGTSAMSDLDGLGNGYFSMFRIFKEKKFFVTVMDRYIFKTKMVKIMFLSYLKLGKWRQAFLFALKSIVL